MHRIIPIIAVLLAVAACDPAPQAYSASHLQRVSGTGVDLALYHATETESYDGKVRTMYRLQSGQGTDGETFTAAIPDLWPELPAVGKIIERYGMPPEIIIADVENGSHLTFEYATGSLYFGPWSDRVIEVRLGDESAGFEVKGVGIGSSPDDVSSAFGAPIATVDGQVEFEDRVLYLPPDGGGYIQYLQQGVRFFFRGTAKRTVKSIYLFSPADCSE